MESITICNTLHIADFSFVTFSNIFLSFLNALLDSLKYLNNVSVSLIKYLLYNLSFSLTKSITKNLVLSELFLIILFKIGFPI